MLSNINEVVWPVVQIFADHKGPFPRWGQLVHIRLILDEPEHQVTFLKGSGLNPAAVITAQVLLVNRRAGCCQVTLLIQQVKCLPTCLLIVSFYVSRHSGRVMMDVARKTRLCSINHEERGVTRRSVGDSIDAP